MTGDMGEMFNDMKEASKTKRAMNREHSTRILELNKVAFESKNQGAHLIVHGKNITFDFWPGTGKYISRSGEIRGRGVFNLLNQLQRK